MKLLYITYIDFGELGSGSSVRPQRMYDAFCKNGEEVYLVQGLQNRRKERRKTICATMEWLKKNRPDACYIEPPSCPIYGKADHDLIRLLHHMGVPTAVFYRDAHWRYADWWGVKGAKAVLLRAMHRRDLKLFCRCCDIVYFPSQTMADLFHDWPLPKIGLLPPGCETAVAEEHPFYQRLVYVGGVHKAYGTDLLLQSMERVNQTLSVELVLCCREEEAVELKENASRCPFLKLVHINGDEIKKLYATCDAGLLPLRREPYMDLAMPVKLFEYLGSGLPVIATDCPEVADFVKNNHCGLVCRDDADSLCKAILQFYGNEYAAGQLQKAAAETAQNNRWQDRAALVVRELQGEAQA